ncbi:hypothetical protein PQQ51_18800 [Paraburkholderia xenovorans]|uniref:hypothetical protein n=1 Tax=Paraburkholderia xenovorans TaxID=36873 RepID=UPI0038B99F4F
MEESCRRVDACRLIPTKAIKSCCNFNFTALAAATFAATLKLNLDFNINCIAGRSLAFNITSLQSPAVFPRIALGACCCDCALFHCFDFLLLHCAAARLPRQNAINGTVQNNAGEDRADGAR